MQRVPFSNSVMPGQLPSRRSRVSRLAIILVGTLLALLAGIAIVANQGWLPHTDDSSGKKTGWFGRELPRDASSIWNPFAAPPPSPTPQLSRSYIYAGSGNRLLTAEDKNATAVPPADLGIWRPKTGEWWIMNSGQTVYQYGRDGDVPVKGDFDGDGKTDFSVFRPSENYWYLHRSSDGGSDTYYFGQEGDIPVPADYS